MNETKERKILIVDGFNNITPILIEASRLATVIDDLNVVLKPPPNRGPVPRRKFRNN